MRSHGSLEDGEGTGGELIFFELGNLVLAKLELLLDVLDILMSSRRWERGRKKDGFRD